MQTKIKLAAIAKNEGAYIPQWVFHHLKAGFDCLELWINGTTDNTRQILHEISSRHPGKIILVEADELLRESKERSVNFQIEAYSKIYKNTKAEGSFTHVFFLDLDEYWISLRTGTSIHDFVAQQPDFDSTSFQWFIDIPSYETTPFAPILAPKILLQKDRHVKSLIKISDKETKILIHNSKITGGNYYLGNGQILEETNAEQEHRQKVSIEYFTQTKKIQDEFFILHLVYKSQTEYLASLTRGRIHVNDNNIFKINRYGYSPSANPDQIILSFGDTEVSDYNLNYNKFLEANNLKQLIVEAQRFVYARCNQALDLIANEPSLLQTYNQQLRGLQIKGLAETRRTSDGPYYHIDVIKLIGNNLTIRGWAWDPLSDEKITLSVLTHCDNSSTIEAIERPDVRLVHPDAYLNCGFNIQISLSAQQIEALKPNELPFKINAQNKYFNKDLLTTKTIVIVKS